MAQGMTFTNYSDEDFIGVWGGEEYHIPAHQSRQYEAYLANHFAKHFIDRELNRKGIPTDHFSRAELLKRCIGGEFEAPSSAKLQADMMNNETNAVGTNNTKDSSVGEIVIEKPKVGRPKKALTEEFAGLV